MLVRIWSPVHGLYLICLRKTVYYITKGVSTLFPSTTLKLDVSLVVKEIIIVTRAKDLTYYDTMIR